MASPLLRLKSADSARTRMAREKEHHIHVAVPMGISWFHGAVEIERHKPGAMGQGVHERLRL